MFLQCAKVGENVVLRRISQKTMEIMFLRIVKKKCKTMIFAESGAARPLFLLSQELQNHYFAESEAAKPLFLRSQELQREPQETTK